MLLPQVNSGVPANKSPGSVPGNHPETPENGWALGCLDFCFFPIYFPWYWSVLVAGTSDQPHILQTDYLKSWLYCWFQKHFLYPGSRWILRPHPTCHGGKFASIPPHWNLWILWRYGKLWRVSCNLSSCNLWMQMNEHEGKVQTKVFPTIHWSKVKTISETSCWRHVLT